MDWGRLTLLLYILARMSGFVLFSPIFGRAGVPAIARSGFILALTAAVSFFTPGAAPAPVHLVDFGLRLFWELALGYFLGFILHLFFAIPQLAGEAIDTQMGMTMAKTYDAGAQASLSVTGSMLTILMFLLFFAANGHNTLLRLVLTSGQVVPFGQVWLGQAAAQAAAELFVQCVLLAVKLALPVLAAELMGQVGMGILMKVIPQINVFAINIELKVLIGLLLLLVLITPFSEFLLVAENQMLLAVQNAIAVAQ